MRPLIDARNSAVEFDRWARLLLDNADDERIRARVEKLRRELIAALVTIGPVNLEPVDRLAAHG